MIAQSYGERNTPACIHADCGSKKGRSEQNTRLVGGGGGKFWR